MKSTIFYLPLLGIMLGCADTSADKSRYNQTTLHEETAMSSAELSCPVISSEDWRVWLVESGDNHGQNRLNISATLTLPTPGYALHWSRGITDRMHPPGLRLTLSATAPKDMVIQVITPTPIKHSVDTPIQAYRYVEIYCGDKLLAKIEGVRLTD